MVFITVFNILINHYRSDLCIAFSIGKSCRGLLSTALPLLWVRLEQSVGIFCESVSHWVIDAILAVNVLPSLYFQMFHHAMYMILIMIIICVFLLCTCYC